MAFEQRDPSMVVFGSTGVRERAYGKHRQALAHACDLLEVEGILDVGPEIGTPPEVGGHPVRVLGRLASDRVSSILAASRGGFLCYPLNFLEKSSVFAAYCSHGVVPVCVGAPRTVTSPPLSGKHFWNGDSNLRSVWDRAHLARQASDWYDGHSLSTLAEALSRLGTRK